MLLAVEDPISQAVARRLVSAFRPELMISDVLATRGRTWIEGRLRELNRTARKRPVLVLLDLDTPGRCPGEEWGRLLAERPSQRMLFRVAVMEIESWVLADRTALARFLGIPAERIPGETDGIPDPKQFIVNLARRSPRRDIRDDLVPAPGGTAATGPVYNPRLVKFVETEWEPTRAMSASVSLRRAIHRIQQLVP